MNVGEIQEVDELTTSAGNGLFVVHCLISAAGMKYLHQKKIIHRDLKPMNSKYTVIHTYVYRLLQTASFCGI